MYQALYRKYRPQTFDDVVGQEGVSRTLKTQLLTGHLGHAYLFTGSRGTGKTSCARILAKAVNCLHPVDGNPCNVCEACRAIDAGSCMDVLEIDAASNNGVDNVRDLRDDAVYTPSQVKTRVYIIDEVHMLSLSAFNALLKIVEEPPEHLLFILATTELHKVPATILSRCQRFSFRRLSQEDIAGRLHYIAYQEGIEAEDAAVQLLARLADGGMRDGISLLDQCATAADGKLTLDAVYGCLGLAGERKTAELMDAVARQDTKTALEIFDKLYGDGKDVAALLDEMCTLTRDLLILKTAPGAAKNLLSGTCTEEEIRGLEKKFSPGELTRILRTIQDTAAGFSKSASRRMDGELCLIDLCDPRLRLDADSINARLSRLEEKIAAGDFVVKAAPAAQPAPEDGDEDRPPFPDDADAPWAEQEAPEAQSEEPARDVPVDFWPELVSRLRTELKMPARGFFAATPNAPVQGKLRGDTLLLICGSSFSQEVVGERSVLDVVSAKASALLGRPVRAQAVDRNRQADANANFSELLSFGQAHSDVIKIKE